MFLCIFFLCGPNTAASISHQQRNRAVVRVCVLCVCWYIFFTFDPRRGTVYANVWVKSIWFAILYSFVRPLVWTREQQANRRYCVCLCFLHDVDGNSVLSCHWANLFVFCYNFIRGCKLLLCIVQFLWSVQSYYFDSTVNLSVSIRNRTKFVSKTTQADKVTRLSFPPNRPTKPLKLFEAFLQVIQWSINYSVCRATQRPLMLG